MDQETLDELRQKLRHQGLMPDDEWHELQDLRSHAHSMARRAGLDPESLAFEVTWLVAAQILLEGFMDNAGSPLYQFFVRGGWNRPLNERRRLAFIAAGISPAKVGR